MVSKKQVDKEVEVQIMIGMMYYCEKEMRLKPKRGKRIALSVSNKAPCNVILEKAMDRSRLTIVTLLAPMKTTYYF